MATYYKGTLMVDNKLQFVDFAKDSLEILVAVLTHNTSLNIINQRHQQKRKSCNIFVEIIEMTFDSIGKSGIKSLNGKPKYWKSVSLDIDVESYDEAARDRLEETINQKFTLD